MGLDKKILNLKTTCNTKHNLSFQSPSLKKLWMENCWYSSHAFWYQNFCAHDQKGHTHLVTAAANVTGPSCQVTRTRTKWLIHLVGNYSHILWKVQTTEKSSYETLTKHCHVFWHTKESWIIVLQITRTKYDTLRNPWAMRKPYLRPVIYYAHKNLNIGKYASYNKLKVTVDLKDNQVTKTDKLG